MEVIFVEVDESHIGKIVAQDIFANTRFPIVQKNAVISPEILHVLKVFNIKNVPILKSQNDKKNRGAEEDKVDIENTIEIPGEINAFEIRYLEAVSQFKKEFLSWQSGSKIDIVKIRGIILPLVDDLLSNRSIIFELNKYSKPSEYVFHHCVATGLISAVLSQKLGFERGLCLQIAIAGMLADCGMSRIPQRIRDKKGALAQHEFAEVRKHPTFSYQMVKGLPALKENMKEAILEHHERLDGSGYPKGLKLDSISTFSQIIAVADTFHAMTSERIYRSKESPFKVVEMIKESEFGKFDIKVVSALVKIVADLPIGTKVELSNFERGEVMYINNFATTRPLVRLFKSGEIVDLSKNRSIYILRVITN